MVFIYSLLPHSREAQLQTPTYTVYELSFVTVWPEEILRLISPSAATLCISSPFRLYTLQLPSFLCIPCMLTSCCSFLHSLPIFFHCYKTLPPLSLKGLKRQLEATWQQKHFAVLDCFCSTKRRRWSKSKNIINRPHNQRVAGHM